MGFDERRLAYRLRYACLYLGVMRRLIIFFGFASANLAVGLFNWFLIDVASLNLVAEMNTGFSNFEMLPRPRTTPVSSSAVFIYNFRMKTKF